MVFSQKLASRYHELKRESLDCVLLMQVGAFMQVVDEDARTLSGGTGLKLQMAGDVDAPVVIGTAILIVDKFPCDSGFPSAKRRGKMPLTQDRYSRFAS